jgi:SAM-dependent methyltransferase
VAHAAPAGGSPELEPNVVASACPACGGRSFDVLSDAREFEAEQRRAERFHRIRSTRKGRAELAERASFTHDYATDLVSCTGCGLLLRSPRPRAADVERAYTEERYPAERLAEMLESQVDSFREKAPVLRSLGGTGRIVEVGSFLGGFLEVARREGWDAVGVDPGKQVAERCRARGLRVVTSTFEDFLADADAGPHDCVAVWNTFDQLPDPRAALEGAARLLRPGGILALRVPHGRYYRQARGQLPGPAWRRFAAERRLAWNNLLSFPYLYGYDVETLDRLVEPFGFARALVRGDVLCRIAGRSTAAWARLEERVVKARQRAAIARQGEDARTAWTASPWLDVYYRRRASRP